MHVDSDWAGDLLGRKCTTKLQAVPAVAAAELVENEPGRLNAERQRSRVKSKRGQVFEMEQIHAEFGNELVKSGSESTIGRMQTGY